MGVTDTSVTADGPRQRHLPSAVTLIRGSHRMLTIKEDATKAADWEMD